MKNKIRPRVAVLAFGLLAPILAITHIISSPERAVGSVTSVGTESCAELAQRFQSASEWTLRYQPLMSRGAFYQNAYNHYQRIATSAKSALDNCR